MTRKLLVLTKKWLRPMFLGMAILLSSNVALGQLSGTVSIGTGGTYTTWSSFATALSTNGHSGGLTVDVLSDLTESNIVYLKSTSTGSSTNTITINGNNKKLTIISPTDKTTTDIQYTSQTNLLTFALQEIRYDFKLLVVEDAKKIILKNQDGQLIYLERKDFEPTN
jgi:hypothetical protein